MPVAVFVYLADNRFSSLS